MSFHVFFGFSAGLAKPMRVPKGTKAAIAEHVAHVEQTLGIKRSKYKNNPVRWDHWDENFRQGFPTIPDELLCETVEQHNRWVRRLYGQFEEWSKEPPKEAETISPKHAQTFWLALDLIEIPVARWTRGYYVARMEAMYAAMRGSEEDSVTEGVTFDAKPLTVQQSAAVIRLFSPYLDLHDMRLDVPKGQDYLASSYDGGYTWCEKCGAVTPEHAEACRKRKCPIRAERGA